MLKLRTEFAILTLIGEHYYVVYFVKPIIKSWRKSLLLCFSCWIDGSPEKAAIWTFLGPVIIVVCVSSLHWYGVCSWKLVGVPVILEWSWLV